MKKILAIVIGFVHDLSAGLWAATVLAVWWLHKAVGANAALAPVLEGLMRQFFWFGLAFVAVVLATGAGRTFTYVDGVYGPDAEKRRRRLLIVKHIVLFTVFGAGCWWQFILAFR